GIELKAKSGDVVNDGSTASGTLTANKAINTESGNPYAAFVHDAQAKLGRDPTRIEIDHMTVALSAQSSGVTSLDQIYTGDVDVALVMNDTNTTYDAGHVMNPAGVGPVDVDVAFASDAVSSADYAKLLTGSFHVVVRGTAAPGFRTSGADANLQVTFSFAAFE